MPQVLRYSFALPAALLRSPSAPFRARIFMKNSTLPALENEKLHLGSECGSALVEFCLFLPTLVFLLLGVADFGLALQQSMVAVDAAHAGALWATQASSTATNSDLIAATTAVSGGQVTVDGTTSFVYACSVSGTKSTTQPTCSSGSLMTWAQVNTHITLPALFGYPGLPGSFTLNGSSTIRVR